MYSRNQDFGRWKEAPRVLRIFWVSALINCAIFLAVSGLTGGYAFAGKREANRYFVGYHSKYVEVSEMTFYGTWMYSVITVGASFVAVLTILSRGRPIRW